MGILDRIKKLCIDKGISVGDLEKELELSNGSIYKWNKTVPGADKVEKVADYFKVTVDFLLGRTAFKTPTELFEHWSGHNDPYFESTFDFGGLLKEVRETKSVSKEAVSEALNITVSDVENIEEGLLPLNYEWAEKYADFLDTSVTDIFIDNGMSATLDDIPIALLDSYREQGMTESEMVEGYIAFRKAAKADVKPLPPGERLSEMEILTQAAHKVGHEGPLTEEEMDKIKLAIQIALAKKNVK